MDIFLKKYTKICQEKYSKKGFVRSRQTFARVINDIFQTFTLKRLSGGRSCTVEFGLYPVCMEISRADIGLYDLHSLIPPNNIFDTEWYYDKNDEDSVNKCLEQVTSAIDNILIPIFNKSTSHEQAFNALFEIDQLCEDNRRIFLKIANIEDGAESPEKSSILATEKYYMALKCGKYDFVELHLEEWIAMLNKSIYRQKHGIADGAYSDGMKDVVNRCIQRETEHLAVFEEKLRHIRQNNYYYFESELKDNKITTKMNLKKFILDSKCTVDDSVCSN